MQWINCGSFSCLKEKRKKGKKTPTPTKPWPLARYQLQLYQTYPAVCTYLSDALPEQGTFQGLGSLGLTVSFISLAWTTVAVDHAVQIFLRKTLRLLITKHCKFDNHRTVSNPRCCELLLLRDRNCVIDQSQIREYASFALGNVEYLVKQDENYHLCHLGERAVPERGWIYFI